MLCIIVKIKLLQYITAVSYTHLDVYKRQPGYRLIIFSKRAVDCIYPLISNYVEVLPLCYEEEYYIINVTTVLKAIDYEKSEYVTFSDGIRVLAFEKYAFITDVVKNIPIFKISDESTRSAFVSDEFKKIVESNNLTGFRLELAVSYTHLDVYKRQSYYTRDKS